MRTLSLIALGLSLGLAFGCGGDKHAGSGIADASGGATPGTGGASAASGGATSGAGGGALTAAGGNGRGGIAGTASGGSPASAGGNGNGGRASNNAGSGNAGSGNAGSGNSAGAPAAGGASSGCGQSGSPTGVQNKQLTVGSSARTYVLSVPSGYDPSKPLPLVLAWHGLGGSGTLARRYFGIEARSAGGAILVYPDGLPQGTDNQTGWDLAATGIDVAFFDALVAETSKAYCVDSKRIFNTGHSFGAMMSNALGCFRGDVLRAIAPVAGMPPRAGGRPGSAATCAGEVAAWIAHGENDETVDFTSGGVATRDFWIGRNGCSASESTPATPAECVAYSACKADLPVQWCVHQDGHNWPSFGGAAIWTFFASFQ